LGFTFEKPFQTFFMELFQKKIQKVLKNDDRNRSCEGMGYQIKTRVVLKGPMKRKFFEI